MVAAELTELLTHEAQRAYVWRATWTGVNAAVAIASMAGVALVPKSERAASIVGSVAAGVSAVAAWGWPLEVESAAGAATRLTNLSATQRIPRLRELYLRAAYDELDRQHWSWHLINVALSLIPGAIIWLGYQQPADAALTAFTGFALGELAIFTQPTGFVRCAPAPIVRLHLSRHGGAISYALVW